MGTDVAAAELPILRQRLVPRPRLIGYLGRDLLVTQSGDGETSGGVVTFSRKLTLIAAPAGYGKSTLVCQWLDQLRAHATDAGVRLHLAWLRLDSPDNDPERFWDRLLGAVSVPSDQPQPYQAGLLKPERPGRPPTQAQIASVLATAERALKEAETAAILVLDDYHVVESPAIHRSMGALLGSLPPWLHLAITSRADPPLPLSRLRARSEMVELRAAHLAFDEAETRTFFSRTADLDLTDGVLTTIAARTEGWVSGLQMAALALRPSAQGSRSPSRIARDLAQTQRYLMDYLADEVLAGQPDEVHEFLLRTSILAQLHAPLCDALVDRPSKPSTELLEHLVRRNLFVEQIDDGLNWYRYHGLFAELLQRRLRAQCPELVPELHLRASQWFEDAGEAGPAIDYALAGRHFERAALLLTDTIADHLSWGENARLQGWLAALPDQVIRTRAPLCVAHAWTMLVQGAPRDAVLDRLDTGTGSAETAGAAMAVRATLDVYRADFQTAVAHAQQALACLRHSQAFYRAVAANALGMAQTSSGDLASAVQAFETVAGIAASAGNTAMTVASLSNLAGLQMVQGHLRSSEAAYQRALALSQGPDGSILPVGGRALMGLGELARERNDLALARGCMIQACDLHRGYAEMGRMMCLLTLARVEVASGQLEPASDAIFEAERLAAAFQSTGLDDRLVAAARVRLWIAEGDLARAGAWADERRPELIELVAGASQDPGGASMGDTNLVEAETATLARVELGRGRHGEALSILNALIAAAASSGRMRRLIELLVLVARAHHAAGATSEALAALMEALNLAAPEGYARTFVDEGEPIRGLLSRLLSDPSSPARSVRPYVVGLLGQFATPEDWPGTNSVADATSSDQAKGRAMLSHRELEVLHLIAQGHTNREIGRRLFIALDTVKGHTREIYGKLAVHSRTRAVAVARELGLLPD